jgi:hypothetical protein
MQELDIYKKAVQKKETDFTSRKENSSEPYDGHINRIILFNLWTDWRMRIFLAVSIIGFLIWNINKLSTFIEHQNAFLPSQRLSPEITASYIKYSLGINGLVMLVAGYWFGARSGSQRLMNDVMKEKITKYLNGNGKN